MTVFADTGFWFGLHVAGDRRHQPAVRIWRGSTAPILTSELVLGETWTLSRMRGVSHGKAVELMDAIRGSARVEVAPVGEAMSRAAWDWLRQHDERVYSFVDATSFELMRRRSLHEALTFDGDFAAAGFVEVQP